MTVEKLLTQWGEECLHAQSKYNRQTIVEVATNVAALSETWMQKSDKMKRQYEGGNAVLLLYPKKSSKPECVYGISRDTAPYAVLKAITVGNNYRKIEMQYVKSNNGVQVEETIGELEIV